MCALVDDSRRNVITPVYRLHIMIMTVLKICAAFFSNLPASLSIARPRQLVHRLVIDVQLVCVS